MAGHSSSPQASNPRSGAKQNVNHPRFAVIELVSTAAQISSGDWRCQVPFLNFFVHLQSLTQLRGSGPQVPGESQLHPPTPVCPRANEDLPIISGTHRPYNKHTSSAGEWIPFSLKQALFLSFRRAKHTAATPVRIYGVLSEVYNQRCDSEKYQNVKHQMDLKKSMRTVTWYPLRKKFSLAMELHK